MNRFRTLAASVLAFFSGSFASAEPLKVGDAAPVVSGVTDSGATLNLGDLYKKNPYTLIYFYPKADTPGCTRQACGIRDAYCREKEIDYFENSRRATLAQRAYAIENPGGWAGYGERLWGLSACDGPVERELSIDGKKRQFHTYMARGASFTGVNDDGTIAPTAAGGSIVFAPDPDCFRCGTASAS